MIHRKIVPLFRLVNARFIFLKIREYEASINAQFQNIGLKLIFDP